MNRLLDIHLGLAVARRLLGVLLDEFTAALGVARRERGRVPEDVEGGFILHPAGAYDVRGGKREGWEARIVEGRHDEWKREKPSSGTVR